MPDLLQTLQTLNAVLTVDQTTAAAFRTWLQGIISTSQSSDPCLNLAQTALQQFHSLDVNLGNDKGYAQTAQATATAAMLERAGILSALGLPATATQADIIGAITALKAAPPGGTTPGGGGTTAITTAGTYTGGELAAAGAGGLLVGGIAGWAMRGAKRRKKR